MRAGPPNGVPSHPRIRAAVSRFAYHDRLEDGEDVRDDTRLFAAAAPLPDEPFVYLNPRRLGHRGMQSGEFQRWSRINPVSAAWAVRVAADMARSLPPLSDEVAILSPYRDQTRLMWALLRAAGLRGRVRAGTVHAFQGSERAGVVRDLVDAPPQGVPGRLLSGEGGSRLLTVGASRARGKLVVLADPELRKGVGAKLLENAMEWRPQTRELAWSSSSSSASRGLGFYPTLEAARADLELDLLGSEFYS